MDGWADSSGRRALLWPHTAACLSVTLYLPASSAKYFKRGEGREKFITNQTTRKKQCLGREEKNCGQAFTRIPDQVRLFSISNKTYSLCPRESKDKTYQYHLTLSAP